LFLALRQSISFSFQGSEALRSRGEAHITTPGTKTRNLGSNKPRNAEDENSR
jgi:hypothetical protein